MITPGGVWDGVGDGVASILRVLAMLMEGRCCSKVEEENKREMKRWGGGSQFYMRERESKTESECESQG